MRLTSAIEDFLKDHDLNVTLVVFDKSAPSKLILYLFYPYNKSQNKIVRGISTINTSFEIIIR